MLHQRRSAMASRGEPGSADEQLNQMIAERRSETGHGSETQPLDFGPLGQLPPIAAGSLLSGLNNAGSFLGSAPARCAARARGRGTAQKWATSAIARENGWREQLRLAPLEQGRALAVHPEVFPEWILAVKVTRCQTIHQN